MRKKPEFTKNTLLQSYYYGFNTLKPPFDNVKVRKAFVMGIDRKQITDLLAADHIPMSGWIPSGMFGYEEKRGTIFDPEAARKLLDEAGFKDRSKFPRVNLAFNTNENHQRVPRTCKPKSKKILA